MKLVIERRSTPQICLEMTPEEAQKLILELSLQVFQGKKSMPCDQPEPVGTVMSDHVPELQDMDGDLCVLVNPYRPNH